MLQSIQSAPVISGLTLLEVAQLVFSDPAVLDHERQRGWSTSGTLLVPEIVELIRSVTSSRQTDRETDTSFIA